MQAAITQRFITSLKPAGKPYEVRDASLKGFILRVQPSGAMSYICEFARGKRLTIGKANVLTPAQARTKATEMLGAAAAGRDPAELLARKRTAVPTLQDFVGGDYGKWLKAHRKRADATIAKLSACFGAEFGSVPLEDITPLDVERWRTKRLAAGIKASSCNRDLGALKAALSKAVAWGTIAAHPLANVKPLHVDQHAVVRYLTAEEEAAVRVALDKREQEIRVGRQRGNVWREQRGYELLEPLTGAYADHLKPMVLVSLNTGLRRGELFSLNWADVDLGRRFLTVHGHNAKSSKTRHIPLNREALDCLKAWKKQGAGVGLVFPGKSGGQFDNVKKAWAGLLEAAKVENFRWHDLRHTFASNLVMAGVDLNTVRELMGHGDIKMTLRYAHLAPEHKAAAVERLSRVL